MFFLRLLNHGHEVLLIVVDIGIAFGVFLLGIVVSELDDDDVVALRSLEDFCPSSFLHEGLGATSVAGMVLHHDVAGEIRGKELSPASFRGRIEFFFVCHCGVADHEEGNGFLSRRDTYYTCHDCTGYCQD